MPRFFGMRLLLFDWLVTASSRRLFEPLEVWFKAFRVHLTYTYTLTVMVV